MGITPKNPADFDPTMGNYKDLRPFRFWCQKVLPLVYDDSLSYYEVLCKVVDYLNKAMEDVGVLHEDVEALHTAYQQLQSYVNDYFSTLDVQQEINNKLDIMASDGTLDALLLPYFNQYKGEINQIVANQNENIENFKTQVNTDLQQQNQRISTQNNNISTLSSRMDSFTHLAEGSTTGDAELTDIRVAYGGKTFPSAGDAVRSVGESLTNNALPVTGQSTNIEFVSTDTGVATNIYLEAGKTYIIKNTTTDGGTMAIGTLYIDGHNDDTVMFPIVRNATVKFTPQYNGYLNMYCTSGSKAGISIVGVVENIKNDIDGLGEALNFKIIDVTTGQYMTGSAVGDSVNVISNAPNWCKSTNAIYVEANTAVVCKTRANGMCCIAVSVDSNIANAKVAVLATNDSVATEYTYYAETACYVFISGRSGETEGYTINGSLIGQELKVLEKALDFGMISTYVGQYMTGSVGGSVTVITNAPNWCRTIDPLFVKANSVIKCKTRGNGQCCIAVSNDNDITNAKVAVVATDDTTAQVYTYTVTSDCYVFISGRANETEGYAINPSIEDIEDIKDYFGFQKIIGLQTGHYMAGTTIDNVVSLSGTNMNWCYTPSGTFVKAGKVVKCRTRGSGFCCIAVASTNDFSTAIIKAVGDDNTRVKEYTYSANSDCYVFISGRVDETEGFIVDVVKDEIETYIVPTGGSFSGLIKSLANNTNEKIIYVEEGEYDVYEELGGDDFIASITDPLTTNWRDVNAIVPPNTTIIGRGNVTLKFAPTAQQIGSDGMAFLFSPLNVSGNCSIENITVYGKNCRYAIHDESSGLSVYADTVHKYKNVRVKKEHGSYGGVQCFGSGMGARCRWEFESCEFVSDRTNVWTVHTTTSTQDDSASFIFNNCIVIKENTESADGVLQLIVGGSGHNAKQNFVRFNNCYVGGSVEIITGYEVTQKFDVTSLMSNIKGDFVISDLFTENPYPVKQYS